MENYSQILYKKDTTGKIRSLHIYTEGPFLYQESGVVGGAVVINVSKSKGKNIGKSNETTPEEQAILEAKSKIEKKLTAGYFHSIEEAMTEEVILPMLANSYDANKINWSDAPVYIQPKFDGMRCLAIVKNGTVTLMSRQGKVIENCQHIIDALMPLTQKEDIVLDGEIYAHGKTFQENMRLVKKYRKGETEQLCYNVYDVVLPNEQYEQRLWLINKIVEALRNDTILQVRTIALSSQSDIKDLHSMFIGEGYEGSIIRHGKNPYEINKRSSSLLKYKDFIDIACKVIDILPSDKRPEQGICLCEMDNGHTFSTGMKFSHEEREEILTNKQNYIGQTAEIRFFEYSEDGIPRFPVCVGFRLDK
jgi:DNA ligase-1